MQLRMLNAITSGGCNLTRVEIRIEATREVATVMQLSNMLT